VRIVISNTGPILHLSEAKELILLSHTGDVYIPKEVDLEMTKHDSSWQAQQHSWLHVETLAAPYDVQATLWQKAGLLDAGEAQAIALAKQMNADWFLTDDAAARIFGKSLGIEVHGSLGVVLWTAAQGHLSYAKADSALDRLSQSSLWISAKILLEAKTALKQLFP